MITYKKVQEKFEDKGFDYTLLFLLPFPPLFDPTCWQLQCRSREELFEEFKNSYPMSYYQQQLEYYNTWIDYQNYK
jgi:hypothetical protein